jgi:hypothetical protein
MREVPELTLKREKVVIAAGARQVISQTKSRWRCEFYGYKIGC